MVENEGSVVVVGVTVTVRVIFIDEEPDEDAVEVFDDL